jgi:hypothetical protein
LTDTRSALANNLSKIKKKKMKTQDYTASITADTTAQEAFDAINNVSAWWTENLEGGSKKMNDAFTVRFGDVHVSTQKLIELIPGKKVVWLVTYSKLTFIEDEDEWTNTTISFDIAEKDGKTQVTFTHVGLVPDVQCYGGCSKGWNQYIKGSLFKLLTEGKGAPDLMTN